MAAALLLRLLIALCACAGLSATAAAQSSLRVGISELPASYGNPYGAIGLPGAIVWGQIFDPLTRIDASGKVGPALATEWARTAPTTWRLKLREGVRYSDGAPFNAEAAAKVFAWLRTDEGLRTIVGNEIRNIRNVRAVDTNILEIDTETPDPILPNRLTVVSMVQPDAWRELGPKAFAQTPIGTGSYVVEKWETLDGSLRLRANPHSWRPPHVGRADLFPLLEHASRFQALISGQLHMATSIRPETLAGLRHRGYTTHTDTTRQVIGMAFDVAGKPDAPTADVRVRKALNLAINRADIVNIITQGTANIPSQGSFPGVFGYNPSLSPIAYDPDAARSLLAEAGYEDGFELTASLVVGTYANDAEIYQMVQQDLAAIGVTLTIRPTVFSDWIRQYLYQTWETEMFSLAWNTSPYSDAQRPMEYFSCRKARPFFCDPELTPLLDRASSELDPEQREQLLFELAEGYRNAWPHLMLLEYGHTWVAAGDIDGFVLEDRVPPLHRFRFEKAGEIRGSPR